MLFDSLFGSILNYGAEIIGNNDGTDLELVHCKFLRKILCVQKSTNLDRLYGETGRCPMNIHRRILMFKYWLKILSLENTSLVKSLYNVVKADAENNISYKGSNWAFKIKTVLNEMGLHNLWINQRDLEH